MSSPDRNQLSFDEEHGRNEESQLNRELPSDSYQTRGNLASILNPILAQDDTSDDFNYLQNIGNWDTVEEMNVQRREERENIDKEVALRAAHITSEQLKTEISQIFSKIEKSTGVKRTRVSQSIRDEAYQNIRKKIRLMVTTEFDLRF